MLRAESIFGPPSNFRRGVSAPQKIPDPKERRISLRDFARFVYGKHAVTILARLTNSDESTVKRWFARRTRAPDRAFTLVLGEFIRRYG